MLLLLGCFRPDPSAVSHEILGFPANLEHALLGLRSVRALELAERQCTVCPSEHSLWKCEQWAGSGSGQKGVP